MQRDRAETGWHLQGRCPSPVWLRPEGTEGHPGGCSVWHLPQGMCPRDSQPGGRDCPSQDRDPSRTGTPGHSPRSLLPAGSSGHGHGPSGHTEPAPAASQHSQYSQHSRSCAQLGAAPGRDTGWSRCSAVTSAIPGAAGPGAQDSLPGREGQGRCRGLRQTCRGGRTRGRTRGQLCLPGQCGVGCGAQDPPPRELGRGCGTRRTRGHDTAQTGPGAGRGPRPLQREESLPVPPRPGTRPHPARRAGGRASPPLPQSRLGLEPGAASAPARARQQCLESRLR